MFLDCAWDVSSTNSQLHFLIHCFCLHQKLMSAILLVGLLHKNVLFRWCEYRKQFAHCIRHCNSCPLTTSPLRCFQRFFSAALFTLLPILSFNIILPLLSALVQFCIQIDTSLKPSNVFIPGFSEILTEWI